MRCIAAGKEELEAGSRWRKIQKQELADKLALGAEPGEPAALGGPAPWHEGCVSHGPHIVHGGGSWLSVCPGSWPTGFLKGATRPQQRRGWTSTLEGGQPWRKKSQCTTRAKEEWDPGHLGTHKNAQEESTSFNQLNSSAQGPR